jgi:hypothetical protein
MMERRKAHRRGWKKERRGVHTGRRWGLTTEGCACYQEDDGQVHGHYPFCENHPWKIQRCMNCEGRGTRRGVQTDRPPEQDAGAWNGAEFIGLAICDSEACVKALGPFIRIVPR